jgi:uncharacterized OsmC-like protein
MADQAEIKTALQRAIRVMELRPAIARTTHRGMAVLDAEGLGCTYGDGTRQIRMDMPGAVGGDGTAPSPGGYVRAALAGCVAIGLRMHASLRDIPLGAVSVDLEVDCDDRGDFGIDGVPPGYEAFRLKIRVESTADRAAVEALVADSLAMSPLLTLHREPQHVTTDVEIVATGMPSTADAAE